MQNPETTVLSFSNDPKHLLEREAAIRNGGFGVISVSSETAARFEIEMGRCGVLLICYTIPPPVFSELASLFRQSCPGGLIMVVLNDQPASEADIVIPTSDGPDAIVRALHMNLSLPKRVERGPTITVRTRLFVQIGEHCPRGYFLFSVGRAANQGLRRLGVRAPQPSRIHP